MKPFSKKIIIPLFFFWVFLMLSFAASATGAGTASLGGARAILGVWLIGHRDAKVKIYKCGAKKQKFCGKIVWVKDGPPTDRKNPDPALRNRPILGLTIMKGFSFRANRWLGGRLYDPKSGNTYKGSMRLASPDRLELRGYVLLPLFGRTDTWTRVKGAGVKGTSVEGTGVKEPGAE